MTTQTQPAAAVPTRALLGRKLGMTQVWDEDGKVVPITVVQVDKNVVTQVRDQETDGYTAIQIGFGQIDQRKVTKPLAGHFNKAGVSPRRHLVEVRTGGDDEFTLGQELAADIFEVGQKVDVTGKTKGKGLRMAGRMGGDRRTIQNLKVQAVDAEKGIVLVTGAIPGPKGGIVLIRSAVKGA